MLPQIDNNRECFFRFKIRTRLISFFLSAKFLCTTNWHLKNRLLGAFFLLSNQLGFPPGCILALRDVARGFLGVFGASFSFFEARFGSQCLISDL